ncbi:STAS/SEC14 domain-containing protein [Aestuariirhabdus sp. LZHN29]|uniref:STAS/SEC14 domain-containing protein n=1 Tax=Aestuariirhabdus sp. LZHN29 TaxID=3417462 RepID=UPI003CE6A816
MIELLDIGINNAVAIRISGKVTEDDMELVLNKAREKIETHGSIVIFEQLDSFKGIEVAAIVEEFKYLFDVGVSNISRAAILTDKKWVKTIVGIEDKVFRHIEMKCFSVEEKELAIEFLKNG